MIFNKLIFILSLILLINTNILFAQDFNSSDVNVVNDLVGKLVDKGYDLDYVINNPIYAKNLFNKHFNEIPEVVIKLFGNEKILFIIEDLDTNMITNLSVDFNKGYIKNLTMDSFKRYTLEIRLSKNTVNNIFSSNDSVVILKKAIADKDITYKGRGFFGSVKFFFVKLFSDFLIK